MEDDNLQQPINQLCTTPLRVVQNYSRRVKDMSYRTIY